MQCWRLRGWMGGAAVLAAVGLLAACAVSRQHAEGLQAMAAGDRERGLAALEAASNAEPTNSQYRMDYLKQLRDGPAPQRAAGRGRKAAGGA